MTATVHPIGGNRAPSLQPMLNLVAPEMNRVNAVILDRMQSEIPLIPELAGHLIAGGGKRMRPMLTLACARLLDYPGDRHHKLAAAVEFIHTATLLHDDVVDGSDMRRGNKDVLTRTLRGLRNCLDQKLLTGVATSLCQTNIDDLLNEAWLKKLIGWGVHYAWYHTYRPVGPKISQELALRPDQLIRIREFVTSARAKLPIALIDAYYDDKGQALCPMATGISHHISPRGHVEPCPIIQFARENVHDKRGIYDVLTKSAFLKDFRDITAKHTRGCIVLERPDLVKELALKHGAMDTTMRHTAIAELDSMTPRTSQHLPGREIPEKHWMYRLAKKYFFNDFGVYDAAAKASEKLTK